MKKVIVAGGASFIGSRLSRELVNQVYRVTIIDELSTGKKANIEPSGNRAPDSEVPITLNTFTSLLSRNDFTH